MGMLVGGASAALSARILARSEEGRPIWVLRSGDPLSPRRVLVVGSIHGEEPAGVAVVRRLESVGAAAGVDLWLVPTVNPDGLAAGRRVDARGVNLNRNFPSGWRPGPRGDSEYPGPRPLSEAGSRAAVGLIERLRPSVTIWFHQPQDLVRAWGPSIPAARRYARLAGMRFAALRWPSGSGPNWQNHRFPGRPAFVVELAAGAPSPALVARQAAAVVALGRRSAARR